jgi:GNAT superfamily N-acetyltransferase
MSSATVHLKTFDRLQAAESEYAALNAFENRLRAEAWPEDPPLPLEQTIRELRSVPPFVAVWMWTAWSQHQIVGLGQIEVMRTEDNQHLAEFHIAVVPEMRQRGIGKRFLPLITETAQREKRRLLMTWTDSAIPAGEEAVRRLGARVGLISRTNQLTLAALNRSLIQAWLERAPVKEFELGLWEGAYPEAEIEQIIKLIEVMNTEPRDHLEMEDWHWTVERIRQWEASLRERRVERWSMYARDRRTGRFAGFTEVFWNPEQPEILRQGATGVFPEYRNHGLGRWLKAAMVEKVLRDRPQAQRIRTGNANSNAPMLKINYELGFKPYKSWTTWQVELDRVLQYLEGTSAQPATLRL